MSTSKFIEKQLKGGRDILLTKVGIVIFIVGVTSPLLAWWKERRPTIRQRERVTCRSCAGIPYSEIGEMRQMGLLVRPASRQWSWIKMLFPLGYRRKGRDAQFMAILRLRRRRRLFRFKKVISCLSSFPLATNFKPRKNWSISSLLSQADGLTNNVTTWPVYIHSEPILECLFLFFSLFLNS